MKSKVPVKAKKPAAKKTVKKLSFPIAAIGASAGGLEAMSLLLKNLAPDTGMAFIFVQHLSPDHKSMLTSILSKTTRMKVQEIDNMELIRPDNIYVIPHNKGIEVTDGHIKLLTRSRNIPAVSIDILFSSLAKTHGRNVIGIVLSGNASDGTQGLKAIKEAGGITFAQDESAKYNSMPASAISEGVVDHVLSPKNMAKALMSLSKEGIIGPQAHTAPGDDVIYDNNPDLNAVFAILHKNSGVDFSHYKMPTVRRRLQRRMLKTKAKTIKGYAKLLISDKKETEALYADLLINVTGFFRDPETFRYLKNTLLPKIIKDKKKSEPLRIWIPACSTGQEVYSIAMVIAEIQDKQASRIPVQIFATDLSEQAVRTARQGEYTKNDLKSLTAARIERFFTKANGRYRVIQHLREMCAFGTSHNILRDPPFSRMDLISCRKLLIYFDAAAQKKVLATFHFSLNDKGYLLLGKSEGTGDSSHLFGQVNSKCRIYSIKKNTGTRKVTELAPRFTKAIGTGKNIKASTMKNAVPDSNRLDSVIDAALLSDHMSACAIINKDLEILQFRGSTSVFLQHPSGRATLHILKMTKPEFAFELREAIHQVIKTKQPVHKADIDMKIGSAFRTMSLDVSPVKPELDEPLLLVVFTLQPEALHADGKPGKKPTENSALKDRKIKKLTTDLSHARMELHSVIELQETAYDELQSANEEIVSSNEEFQTLNEELESTKEEIEATNEELLSTNRELKKHNALLEESYNYSQTIIATIHEPMLILDADLRVKSANESFYKKFMADKEDTEGHALFELGNKQWNIPKLRNLLERILSKNAHFENLEVTHVFPGIGEKVMLLNASRIIQKTHREKLILLAIKDITDRAVRQRKADGKNQENKLELEAAVADRTKQLNHKNIQLENANKKLVFQNEEKEKRTAELGIANTELAFQINEKEKRATELGIANTKLAFQNNEKEKRAVELSIANKDLTSFTYISSHDLQEPLRKIRIFADCLLNDEAKHLSDSGKNYLKRMMDTARRMQSLIDALLTYSRTRSDDRVFESTDLNLMMEDLKEEFAELLQQKKGAIQTEILCEAKVIPFQIQQLFQNLISNSLKFSKPGLAPLITVKSGLIHGDPLVHKDLEAKTYCHIVFTDNGIGFDPIYRTRIFEVFKRLHSTEEFPGTGIGLAICKRIVENHHGIIAATGEPGKGVRFDIYIPAG